ncbi:hypothetical protein SNEBB_008424 [Seison nebaliae]|nr:hypothetical protein SNEBB_008424 [Seison nebaliae]
MYPKLRQFDAYPKTLDDFTTKTYGGGIITICSIISIVILFFYELNYFLTISIKQELFVDTTSQAKIPIDIDIIFHKIPCHILNIDAIDSTGSEQDNVMHRIHKRRIDLSGNVIDSKQAIPVALNNQKKITDTTEAQCLPCFGAETPEIKCCNDCDMLKRAYRLKNWSTKNLKNTAQCGGSLLNKPAHLNERIGEEGCQIYGFLEVNKVAGNVHITLGRSIKPDEFINIGHFHDLGDINIEMVNISHTINKLNMGKPFKMQKNPLTHKNHSIVPRHEIKTIFYYLKIVPTMYETIKNPLIESYQYSVTRHQQGKGERTSTPGIFFQYEISPIVIKYLEKSHSLSHFLTSACAIIGGVFTVAGIVDAIFYRSSNLIAHLQKDQ